jgi:hypothetical protein
MYCNGKIICLLDYVIVQRVIFGYTVKYFFSELLRSQCTVKSLEPSDIMKSQWNWKKSIAVMVKKIFYHLLCIC